MQDVQSFDECPVIYFIAKPPFIAEALANHIEFSSRYKVVHSSNGKRFQEQFLGYCAAISSVIILREKEN